MEHQYEPTDPSADRVADLEASLAAMRVMVTAMIWMGVRDESKSGDFVKKLQIAAASVHAARPQRPTNPGDLRVDEVLEEIFEILDVFVRGSRLH